MRKGLSLILALACSFVLSSSAQRVPAETVLQSNVVDTAELSQISAIFFFEDIPTSELPEQLSARRVRHATLAEMNEFVTANLQSLNGKTFAALGTVLLTEGVPYVTTMQIRGPEVIVQFVPLNSVWSTHIYFVVVQLTDPREIV